MLLPPTCRQSLQEQIRVHRLLLAGSKPLGARMDSCKEAMGRARHRWELADKAIIMARAIRRRLLNFCGRSVCDCFG